MVFIKASGAIKRISAPNKHIKPSDTVASGSSNDACLNTVAAIARLGAETKIFLLPSRNNLAAAIPNAADFPRPRSADRTRGRRR